MGVDYYNCEYCKEIYADCGWFGWCDLCYSSECCITCHFKHSTLYNISGNDFTICERHYDDLYYDSDTDSETKSKTESETDSETDTDTDTDSKTDNTNKKENWILKEINDKFYDKGVHISSLKELRKLKVLPQCQKCNKKNCKKFTEHISGGKMKYDCCVCNKSEKYCKDCKKTPEYSIIEINNKAVKEIKTGLDIEKIKDYISKGYSNFTEGLNICCIENNYESHIEIAKLMLMLMLDHGHNSNKIFDKDMIVLAIKNNKNNNKIKLIEYLFNTFTDIIVKDIPYFEDNILSAIIKNPTVELYELFIKYIREYKYAALFNYACLYGSVKVIEYFLNKINIVENTHSFNNALIFAVMSNKIENVKFLLEKNSDNITDYQNSIFYLCTHPIEYKDSYMNKKKFNEELIYLLFDKMSSIDKQFINKCFAGLAQSEAENSIGIAHYLISKGANNFDELYYNISKSYNSNTKLKELAVSKGAFKFIFVK